MSFLNDSGLSHLWSHIILKLNTKVDKVDGKGLSTNDYTTAEKEKLSGISEGATNITVDSALSDTSTNPVQNKVIKETFDSLATVAVDDSLSIRGAAADAKAVGDWMNDVVLSENNYGTELPETLVKGKIFFVEDTEEKYPIGSIYMSVNSTSPASLFGGTWEQIKDVFLLAAGSSYTAGSTGGEATHTLTINEIPSHTHTFSYTGQSNSTGVDSIRVVASNGTANAYDGYDGKTGGGAAHNNMPPYLAVYIWKRVA